MTPQKSCALLAALLSLFPLTPAMGAEWTCEISRYVTGGTLHLSLQGDGTAITSVTGSVDLATARVAPPLGLRDGTFTWDASAPNIAPNGGVLSLSFRADGAIGEMPTWGAATGMIVPTQLRFLLPALRNPAGTPVRLGAITLITGNGLYNSTNTWAVRGNTNAIMISNAPDPVTPIYSRELLQLISDDPNEPLSLFLTPALPAPTDSIASFHAGGIAEAPGQIRTLIGEFVAAGGVCPETDPALTASTEPAEPDTGAAP